LLLYAVQGWMRRLCLALFSGVVLLACNPTNGTKHCEGVADFTLTLNSPTDSFPADTEITVTFGGGSEETYSLSAPNDPEVLFCETTKAPGTGSNEGGAGGANSGEAGSGGSAGSNWHGHGGAATSGGAGGTSRAVSSIQCEIWSGGPATVSIHAGAWHTKRDLKPDEERCSLDETIVLGEPDPKP